MWPETEISVSCQQAGALHEASTRRLDRWNYTITRRERSRACSMISCSSPFRGQLLMLFFFRAALAHVVFYFEQRLLMLFLLSSTVPAHIIFPFEYTTALAHVHFPCNAESSQHSTHTAHTQTKTKLKCIGNTTPL